MRDQPQQHPPPSEAPTEADAAATDGASDGAAATQPATEIEEELGGRTTEPGDQVATVTAVVPGTDLDPPPSTAFAAVARVTSNETTIEEPEPELEATEKVGRFVILERLGQGGMGVVYGAFDSVLDRKVALKLLRTRGGINDTIGDAGARLLREAKAMARLSHPNIVALHDFGTVEGRVFFAMEYVEGSTLTAWLRARKRTWQEIRDVFAQAGRGLAVAHAGGLVHRDFKPDNVLVGSDGRVRVTDFGLARIAAESHLETADFPAIAAQSPVEELTQPGLVMGTLPYMAPEQTTSDRVDPAIDQFSFCVTLFEAIYGLRPFTARKPEERARQIAQGRLRKVPKSAAPAWLHRVIVRGLAADPSQRWPSMDALVQKLQRRTFTVGKVTAIAAATALAVTGVVAGWSALASSSDPCSHLGEHMQRAWNAEHARGVKEALLAGGRPHAPHTARRAIDKLDDYVAMWSSAVDRACESAEHGEHSQELLSLQARCYARSVDVVGELVRTIKNGDRSGADGADRVLWAIDSLPALEACSDIASLRNDLSDFGSSAEARRQAALRTHLEQLRVLVALRPNASSEGRAQRLRAEAEQLGQPSLEALAVFYYGQLLSEQGHRSRARELFENAVALAERADNRSLMAKAAIAALGTFGPEETDSATKWEDIARQALAEIGTGELLADFHDTLGKLFAGRRDYARARVELEQAVDLRERILGARHPTVSRSLLTLGDVLRAQGNDVAARSVYARALTAAEDAWGEQHPELAPILERLAILAERTEELSTAQAFRQRAQSL